MSSTLFSTSCYIETKPYTLCICIDNDSNKVSVSTIDDILSMLDTDEATSESVGILNTIRLCFESLTDVKTTSTHDKDETIILNKLLHIKQSSKVSNFSSSLSSRFERVSSQETNKNDKLSSSESVVIDISYVDISESFIWSVKRIQAEMNSTTAQQLCLISSGYLSKLKNRPQHLLAFVNPECGKGIGSSVYEEQVVPLFEEANIRVNTIYTERANHARDYISKESLDGYDGLISVGGDGMFAEVCHSLLLRTARQAGLNINESNTHLTPPQLRIGVIPAGSTDAIAFGTTGHNDPVTNALQIILGEALLIDIATVHNEHGFVCFLATMFAYGFFGNIIEQSENWRFVGPLRYTLAGIVQFIQNRSYHTELVITQASEKRDSKVSSAENSTERRETSDENSTAREKLSSSRQIKRQGYYQTINCLNMSCRCEKSKFGMSPSVRLADGSFDVILVKHSWWLPFFRFLHQVANDGREIEDLSNVERYRVTEVFIRPILSQEKELGNWACDGELIEAKEVTIRAHRQALNLFASGIRLEQIKKINKEESKVTRIFIMERLCSLVRSINYRPCISLLCFYFYYFYFSYVIVSSWYDRYSFLFGSINTHVS